MRNLLALLLFTLNSVAIRAKRTEKRTKIGDEFLRYLQPGLYFSSLAYVLVHALRRLALAGTQWAHADDSPTLAEDRSRSATECPSHLGELLECVSLERNVCRCLDRLTLLNRQIATNPRLKTSPRRTSVARQESLTRRWPQVTVANAQSLTSPLIRILKQPPSGLLPLNTNQCETSGLEAGHFLVLDTSDIAANTVTPVASLNNKLLTDPTNRPVWLQNPSSPTAVPNVFPNGCGRLDSTGTIAKDCPNSHSAVQVPSRQLALTTDEIYGTFTLNEFGCRWGWMRLIDISDPGHPFITGEFQLDQNQLSFCGSAADTPVAEQFRSFSTHNPTVLPDLAFIDWHSNGVQAIDISNPSQPTQAGFFRPTPIPVVANEDPALSQGPAKTVKQLLNPSPKDLNNPDFLTKVLMWSYPIINNGLIYVIDVRNGLFILRYTGPHSAEVQQIKFLEGNSNLGDALKLDQP